KRRDAASTSRLVLDPADAGDLEDAGDGNLVRLVALAPREVLLAGEQILVRRHGLLPSHLLAGLGGHAAHDRHHRGVDHARAIVDVLSAADRLEKLVVLDLVHVRLALARFAVAPEQLAVVVLDVGVAATPEHEGTLGAAHVVGVLVEA